MLEEFHCNVKILDKILAYEFLINAKPRNEYVSIVIWQHHENCAFAAS